MTESDSRGPSRVVFIAEDNATNAVILVKMLQKLGCETLVVSDGAAAVKALHHTCPDIILMDINMPLMDGIAAAKEIRRLGLARDVPIIAVTAKPMPTESDTLAEMNLDAVIPKPVRLTDLSAALDRWLA